MASQAEETPSDRGSLVAKLATLLWSILRLIYAWALVLYFVGWMELGQRGGVREIYAHVRGDPWLATTVTIALLAGWLVATPRAKPTGDWIYRHPLLTQALVGAAVAALLLVPLLWLGRGQP